MISLKIRVPLPQTLDGVTVNLPDVANVEKEKLLVGVAVESVKLTPVPE